jgi:DNA mismatch repair protein MutL
LFLELLKELADFEDYTPQTINKHFNSIAATIACHSSIRAGDRLDSREMNQLIINLYNCKQPYSCPHGRPIIWEISKHELETNFRRLVN